MEKTTRQAAPPQDVMPPRVLDALSLVHERALQGRALDKKTKELIALATSMTTGSDTGIAYHLHNALEADATREEIVEAVEVAVLTMGEPGAVHAAQILRALDLDVAGRFTAETGLLDRERLRQRAAAHPYMPPD